jgi:hypothetical protein
MGMRPQGAARYGSAAATRIAFSLASAVMLAACGGDSATAPSGRAASLTKRSETDNQSAVVNTAVALPPSVTVFDTKGRALGGVSVTFAVTAGGGTVSSASTSGPATSSTTVVTNASGVATVTSWTMGPTEGENHLRASVNGVPPADFVAVASDPCSFAAELTLGSAAQGELTSQDCDDDYFFYDFHRTNVVTGGAVLFTLESNKFDAFLELVEEDGSFIAINDDRDGTNAGIKAILRTRNYIVVSTTFDEHETGPYTVSAKATDPSIEQCEEVWVSTSINSAQTLKDTDCTDTSGTYYSDVVLMVIHRGQTVTITMNSTAVDAYLILADVSGAIVAQDDNSNGGTNARIVFTATDTKAYYIDLGTAHAGETGAYTFGIH